MLATSNIHPLQEEEKHGKKGKDPLAKEALHSHDNLNGSRPSDPSSTAE